MHRCDVLYFIAIEVKYSVNVLPGGPSLEPAPQGAVRDSATPKLLTTELCMTHPTTGESSTWRCAVPGPVTQTSSNRNIYGNNSNIISQCMKLCSWSLVDLPSYCIVDKNSKFFRYNKIKKTSTILLWHCWKSKPGTENKPTTSSQVQ